MMSRGWIYCLSNKAMPGLLKIGKTKNCPQLRAEKLQTTGVPHPFDLEIAKKVYDFDKKEKLIHSILENFGRRVNPKREFFEVNLETVKCVFELMDGNYFPDEKEDEISVLGEILQENTEIRHIIGDHSFIEGIYYHKENSILFADKKFSPEELHQFHCEKENVPDLKYSLHNYELYDKNKWVPVIEYF